MLGLPWKAGARVHEVIGGGVLGMIGDHRRMMVMSSTQPGHVRKQFADVRARLAVFSESERRGQNLVADIEDGRGRLERQRLAAFLLQPGLGIEGVYL
jgi:hypothetical protein